MIEISLQDIEIDFGFEKILKGVSFTVQAGEKVALVGANGSGKTTLLRIIMGQHKSEKGLFTLRKGASLGYLDQKSEVPQNTTVEDFIKEAHAPIFALESRLRQLEGLMASSDNLDKLMREYDRLQNEFITQNGYETDENFNKILSVFKITPEMLRQNCGELSGGQQTIVKLARVLLESPDILLLDEPTNHLDLDALDWLESFIRSYAGTVVLVSHDRYFLDKTVKKTILLNRGQAEIFNGNYSYCLEEQERQDMLEFEKYKDQQKMITAMKAAIKRFRDWGNRSNPPNAAMFRRAKNMERRLEKLELVDRPQADRKLPINFEMDRRSGKRVIEFEDLCFAYNPQEEILTNAQMELLFQERLCIMGSNGSGKTTIINLILGNLEVSSGVLRIAESAKIGYIPQNISFEDESESILDAFRKDAKVHENEARRILAKYFIAGDNIHKRLNRLSGGERVILRLAMLMQQKINFLILDEPTNHLDIDTKELLEESLVDYKGSLLFISHDRYFIKRLATRVVQVENGVLTKVDAAFS